MYLLDNPKHIKLIDAKNVLGSIEALPDQIKQTWDEVSKLNIPQAYRRATNIVINGMGGSALGARVVQSVFSDTLKIPLTVVNNYDIPAIVGPTTLYIASSYSGTTEETITAYQKALKKKAMIFSITTGGTLKEQSKKNRTPCYVFSPTHNPSNQPRMALGYSITSQVALLNRLGFVKTDRGEIKKVLDLLRRIIVNFGISVTTEKNPLKLLAGKVIGKIPIFIGGEFLAGSLHTLRNQFNENTKSYADYHVIPELNHHLMEGLKHPASNKDTLHVVFFESGLYPQKIALRMSLTQEIVTNNGIGYSTHCLEGKTKLEQAFELIHLGSYLNYYVALLYEQNPAPIPWVDYFKEKLQLREPRSLRFSQK